MKNKNKAALLALTLGVVGAHRWYLGQTGKALLCIPFGIFTGPLFAVKWLLSSNESFDNKYNNQRIQREILSQLKK